MAMLYESTRQSRSDGVRDDAGKAVCYRESAMQNAAVIVKIITLNRMPSGALSATSFVGSMNSARKRDSSHTNP